MGTIAVARRATLMACSVLALACGDFAAAQSAPQDDKPRRTSQQELTYEIANTYRILADEQFLNGQTKAADANYQKAEDKAKLVVPETGLVSQSDTYLLQTEIAYRRLLLKNDVSFWGFEHEVRPISPVLSWMAFDETRRKFADEVAAIEQLAAAYEATGTTAVTTETSLLRVLEQQAVSSLDADAAEANLRDAEGRRKLIDGRISAIATRQTIIASERQSLEQQMSSVTASLNGMMLEAVSSAAGLPPNAIDLVDAAAKGDVKKVLQEGVAAYAAADPKFTQSLGTFAEDARVAAVEYKKLEALGNDIQTTADQGAQLMRAVQAGDVTRVLTVGAELYNKLPAETRSKLTAAIDESESLQPAFALARKGTELRSELVDKLKALPAASSLIRPHLYALFDTGSERFDNYYALALGTAIGSAQDAAAQQDALIKLSRAWSTLVIDEGLKAPEVQIAVAAALGSPCKAIGDCRDFLIAKLNANGLDGPAVTVDAAGLVSVRHPSTGANIASFDLKNIASRTLRIPIDVPRAALRADADALLTRLDAGQGAEMTELLKAIPDLGFDRVLGAALTSLSVTDSKALVQSLAVPGADGEPSVLGESIASFALGRDLAQRTVLPSPPSPATPGAAPSGTNPPVGTAGAAGSGANANEQIALQALAATGPYGMAASMAIKMLAGMGQLSDLADQADRLDKEDRALTVEVLHLGPLKRKADLDEALATLAHRAAFLRSKSAANRSRVLQSALLNTGQNSERLYENIRDRLPLTFYLSELLRQRYDRLDRSLAVWLGPAGTQGGHITTYLRRDANSARLALDPDIKLYTWFQRDWQGQRYDLQQLAQRWNQIYNVADKVCADIGCGQAMRDVGIVEYSTPVALEDLTGKIGPAGSIRDVSFTLLPQHLAGLPELGRLRIVDVSAVIRNKKSGARSTMADLRVRHTGAGYILAGGVGLPETLDASQTRYPMFLRNEGEISARSAALQSRWTTAPTLTQLEGYALFGLYVVRLPAAFDPAAQSLDLTFFYQRPRLDDGAATRLPTAALFCGLADRSAPIDFTDIRLLAKRGDNGEIDRVAVPDSCRLQENRP